MQWLVEVGLSNALAVVVLAIVASLAGKIARRPAVTHALWLLVLVKLLTPPIIELPLPWSIARSAAFDAPTVDASQSHAALRSPRENQTGERSQVTTPQFEPDREFAIPPNAGGNFVAVNVEPRQSRTVDSISAAELRAADATTSLDAVTDVTAVTTAPHSAIVQTPTTSTIANRAESWRRFGQLAAIIWLIGLVAWTLLQAALWRRLRAVLRASAPAPVELCEAADQIARRMGLKSRPQVRIVAANVSPMLCGLARGATILIPAALLSRLGAEAQKTVLAHELAHYRRGDQWVRLVELVVTGLYWWHPVVWWARRQIEIAEEQCCDAHVIELSAGKSRVYAEALLDIVDLISEAARPVRPAMSTGIGQRPLLQRRLVDLMKRRCVPTMTPLARRVILAAAAVSLACHPSLFVTESPKVAAATANNLAESARRILADPPVAAGGHHVPWSMPADLSRTHLREPQSPHEASAPPLAQSFPSPVPTEAITETNDEPPEYDESQDYAWATSISPNGRFHITVRRGYECELREVTSDQVRRLSGHRITCVAFTADSARFVTGDLQGTVRVWDSASGEVLQSLTRREGPVHSVCIAPSGDYAAVAGHDGVVELVSLVSPEDRRVVAHPGAPVRCVRFSPDGASLVIATDTWKDAVAGAIDVYDVATRTRLHHWNIAGPLGAVDFPSQDCVVTVEWSGRVRQWALPGLAATDLPPIAKELVSAASFSVDTRVLEDLAQHITERL